MSGGRVAGIISVAGERRGEPERALLFGISIVLLEKGEKAQCLALADTIFS
jgi:hypothetical protein